MASCCLQQCKLCTDSPIARNPDVKKAKKGPCFHGSKTCRRYFAFGAAHTLWRCPFQRAASDSIAMLWLSQLAVDSTRVVLAQHLTSQLSERA